MPEVVPATAEREEGIVKWWRTARGGEGGYGVLIPVCGGKDVFVHRNQLEFEPRELVEGEHVTFEWANGLRGPKANHVRRIT